MQERIKSLSIQTSIVLAVIVFTTLTLYAQENQSIRAQVTFLDRSVQDVEQVKFVYNWIYENDQKYINAPNHRKETDDFHYTEVVRKVRLDRTLSSRIITKIELSWAKHKKKSESYFSPDRITITLNDGKRVILKDIDATSAFLQDNPVEKITYEAVLRELKIEGFVIVEGQRGEFTGRIFCRSGVHLQSSDVIKEITFITPKE